MRKIISFLCVLSLLSALFAPFSLFGDETAPAPAIWSGKTAGGFAGGDGSTNDPFRVESAEQFAYFAKEVNGGRSFANKTVLLACDIYLNDEIFSFNADTGLVKVSGGENFAYLSLGIRGDDSGENEIFDSMHIPGGCWLKSDTLQAEPNGQSSVISDCYRGTVHAFSPINGFDGIFDGGGHSISGLYIHGEEDTAAALFGRGKGSIRHLYLNNSLIHSGLEAASIALQMQLLEDCHSNAFVYAPTVGGVGLLGDARFCSFGGVVSGIQVGGVMYGANVSHSQNSGSVYGIAAGGILYNGSALYCENSGNVTAFEYKADALPSGGSAGGIVYAGSASHCQNLGTVRAHTKVGGIAANNELANEPITYCQNRGKVTGVALVGGIAGVGNAQNCSNHIDIHAEKHAGGIVGAGNCTLCANFAPIEAREGSGGIMGGNAIEPYAKEKFTISKCYNMGAIKAENAAGGILGEGSNVFITDCYNTASVSWNESGGGTAFGGIAGRGEKLTIQNCYNVGNIRANLWVGGVLGEKKSGSTLKNCCFQEGCAANTSGTVFQGIGSNDPNSVVSDPNTLSFKGAGQSNFNFDFTNIWRMAQLSGANPYYFPVLQELHHGEHIFDGQEGSAILRDAGDCTHPATYYPVCACGMANTAYYSAKEVTHQFSDLTADDDYHFRVCTLCNHKTDLVPHKWGGGKPWQKGNEHFVLYKCTDCGKELSLPLASYETDLPTLTVILYIAAGGVVGALGVFSFLSLRTRAKKQKKTKDFV
ncbi:MAG: hypothetical protein E7616_01005 [Ruminococcaceae bacterium]|nr:hypothetical protein [Oscillospiraceae bacterium]